MVHEVLEVRVVGIWVSRTLRSLKPPDPARPADDAVAPSGHYETCQRLCCSCSTVWPRQRSHALLKKEHRPDESDIQIMTDAASPGLGSSVTFAKLLLGADEVGERARFAIRRPET
jgi:hypothetical protein